MMPAPGARALIAAQDPHFERNLEKTPLPLTAERMDDHLGATLPAARSGNLGLIPDLPA